MENMNMMNELLSLTEVGIKRDIYKLCYLVTTQTMNRRPAYLHGMRNGKKLDSLK
jgi:hypothetical protein